MFELKIETGNEAFRDSDELVRLIRKVADRVARGEDHGRIIDANGNTVGEFESTPY